MGKNNGKRGVRTPYAEWTSIMRKLDNELEGDKKKMKASDQDKEK